MGVGAGGALLAEVAGGLVAEESGHGGGLQVVGGDLVGVFGAEGVFVGSGIFKSSDPAARARAIVQATTHYKDPDVLARVSEELGEAMAGIETSKLKDSDLLQTRGW